ncbi:DoxX family protein [Terrimonas sp. NA20]|uniref:DoxX family protein n=1 Tax=Terrimonas ginsenosidimutans TaxID=2908004 RepID=A0ABS9KKP8_9BACT|nr:DoxX family protein [Terrimonas ginsenosidimutans]MCG2612890.1 DoxX family protein [Terrimonas ginsenosidimutans]
MKFVLITGRILFSLLFILSSFGHFKAETIAFAGSQGLPLASVLVPLSGVVELIGGLSILVGYRAKLGAWLLVIFLIPVTFMFHQFWTITDPMTYQMQFVMFMKNISITGGALLIAYFGSGELSIDAAGKSRSYSHSSGKEVVA